MKFMRCNYSGLLHVVTCYNLQWLTIMEAVMKRASLAYIVRSYGGVTAFSRECLVTPSAVYGWLRANSLPLKRAVDMAALYGVSRDLFYDPWHGSEHGSSEIMTDEETQLAVFGKGA